MLRNVFFSLMAQADTPSIGAGGGVMAVMSDISDVPIGAITSRLPIGAGARTVSLRPKFGGGSVMARRSERRGGVSKAVKDAWLSLITVPSAQNSGDHADRTAVIQSQHVTTRQKDAK
jgi:hypothetical protein